MERFLAELFLIIAGMFLMLGNFWYTYGIWPRSWGSFALFAFLTVLLLVVRTGLSKK